MIAKNGKKVQIEAQHGGTLSPRYKSKLSRYVYDQILLGEITWADLAMSKHLEEIVTSLYKFVQSKNNK